jgi:tetratricopeptide (TPR) repeat protein
LLLRSSAFGIFWFYIALVMECSIIPMDDLILEHRTYLPAFGFLLASVSLVMLTAIKFGLQRIAGVAGIAVIVVFAVLTLHRNEQWRDPLVFWQDALTKSPNKHRIHGYIGNVYRDRGDIPRALQEYRLMLANDFRYGQDHFELGEMLMEKGMYHEAVAEFLVASKIRPDKTFIYGRLAEAYRRLGDLNLADEAMRKGGNTPVQKGSRGDSDVWEKR